MTIKRQLLIFVLCAILPIFIFSAILLGLVAQQQNHAFDESLRGNVRALAQAVEKQITSIESNLAILAVVEDFDDANLRDLHRRLRRFVKGQENWSSIGLASTDGQQIFSTLADFGASLPSWKDQSFFQEIVTSGKSHVSGFRMGKMIHQPVFSVGVPIKEKGVVKYILVATIRQQLLFNMLVAQKLPSEWNAVIFDVEGTILARSRFNEKFVGTKVKPHLMESIKNSPEDFFESINLEGNHSFGAHFKIDKISWSVVLSIPFSESQFMSRRIFWILIVGGFGLLTIGTAFAMFFGQKIANSIIGLSDAARALGRGDDVSLVNSNLTEVNDVAMALVNASIVRAKSDRESQELYKKAQEAIELRDNFLSVASHELKTPLTTINLQAQILTRNLTRNTTMDQEKLQTSLGRIGNQLKRLTNLIDDLLDISRITAGRLEINKEAADLHEITKDIVAQFEEDYTSKGSSLHYLSQGTIPGHFDKGRVEQIITNLVSNAIKYGEGNPIRVLVSSTDEHGIVQVIDNGKGIDPSFFDRIFERFERVDPSPEVGGLGLGLWIVKRLVERLGGEITVDSKGLGTGSTFTLKLPRK